MQVIIKDKTKSQPQAESIEQILNEEFISHAKISWCYY
jgi:hypothetical protein